MKYKLDHCKDLITKIYSNFCHFKVYESVSQVAFYYSFSLELCCMDASAACQGVDKEGSVVSHPAIIMFRQLRLVANAPKTLQTKQH